MEKVCQHSSNSPTRKKSLYINRFLAWSPFSVSFSPTEKQNSGAREKKLLFGKTFCVCNDTFKMQTTYFKATESQLASLQRKEIKRMENFMMIAFSENKTKLWLLKVWQ